MLLKKITLYSLTAVLCAAGQGAFAHTGVRDQVVENKSGYNALTVGHGCNGNTTLGPHRNVVALSVVFPNGPAATDSVAYKLNASGIQEFPALPDLSEHIDGINPGDGFTKLGLGLVGGGGTLFANFMPTLDGNNLARGFHNYSGPAPYESAPLMESANGPGQTSGFNLTGLAPFKYGAIKFKPTSCAKALKVRIAVANWCRRGVGTYGNDDRADIWIGHLTTKFNDQKTMPRATPYDATVEAPYWPSMTVNRDLVANPFTDAAGVADGGARCGTGFDLSVEPSDAVIDQYLPIPVGVFPAGAPAPKFWPSL
ncbi:MAG: hypothetical protein ACXWTS_03730 [Methylococcaceae bacterium]